MTKQHFCIGNSILPHSLSFLIQHHFLTLHLMNSDFTVFSTSLLLPTLQQFYCSQVSDSPHSFCSVSCKFLCVFLRVSQLYSVPWISIHASIPCQFLLMLYQHGLKMVDSLGFGSSPLLTPYTDRKTNETDSIEYGRIRICSS